MKLQETIQDHNRIIIDGFYGHGYPWQTGYDTQLSGCSVAQDGCDILRAGEVYSAPGMRLRDAIRHAQIKGDSVPDEAYNRLASMARPVPSMDRSDLAKLGSCEKTMQAVLGDQQAADTSRKAASKA